MVTTLSVDVKTNAITVTTVGQVTIGAVTAKATVSTNTDGSSTMTTTPTSPVSLKNMLGASGDKAPSNNLFGSQGSVGPRLVSLGLATGKLSGASMTASWGGNSTSSTIQFSGHVPLSSGLPRGTTMAVTVTKSGKSSPIATTTLKVPNGQLSSLLSTTSTVDITKVSILGNLQLSNVTLTISNISEASTTPPGSMTMIFALPFPGVNESIPTVAVVKDGVLNISIQPTDQLTVRTAIDRFVSDPVYQANGSAILQALPKVPAGMVDPLSLEVSGMVFVTKTRTTRSVQTNQTTRVRFTASLPPGNRFTVIPNLLTLTNVKGHIDFNPLYLSDPVVFTTSGYAVLGNFSSMSVTLSGDATHLNASANLHAKSISLPSLASSLFQGSLLPPRSPLNADAFFTSKLTLSSANLSIIWERGGDIDLTFSGAMSSPALTVQFMVLGFNSTNCTLALAGHVGSISVNSLTQALLGFDMSYVPLLATLQIPDLVVFMANSSSNLQKIGRTIHFTNFRIRQLVIPEAGLFVFFPLTLRSARKTLVKAELSSTRVSMEIFNDVKGAALQSIPQHINIKEAMDTLASTVTIVGFDLPPSFPDVFNIDLNNILYVPDEDKLSFEVVIPYAIELVPGFVNLTKVRAAFTINTTDVFKFDFTASGEFSIGPAQIMTSIAKLGPVYIVKAWPSNNYIDLLHIAKVIGGSILPSGDIQASLQKANLDKFGIGNPLLTFQLGANGTHLSLQGDPVVGSLPSAKVFIGFFDMFTNDSIIVTNFDVPSVSLAKLVKTFDPTMDISGIPVIGTLILPRVQVTWCNVSCTQISLSDMAIVAPRLVALGNLPQFGVDLNFQLTLPNIKNPFRLNANLNFGSVSFKQPSFPDFPKLLAGLPSWTADLPDVRASLGPLSLTPPSFPKLSIGQWITALLGVQLPPLNLPFGFPDPMKIGLDSLNFDPSTDILSFQLSFPFDVKLFGGVLNLLKGFQIKMSAPLPFQKDMFNFDISGIAKLGANLSFNFRMTRIPGLGFTFSANCLAPTVGFVDLVGAFGSIAVDPLQNPIVGALKMAGLDKFTIGNLSFSASFLNKTFIQFSGLPNFGGWSGSMIEIVFPNAFSINSSLIFAMSTPSVQLSSLVKTFVPTLDISQVPFIGSLQVPKLSIMIANTTILPSLRVDKLFKFSFAQRLAADDRYQPKLHVLNGAAASCATRPDRSFGPFRQRNQIQDTCIRSRHCQTPQASSDF